jgi:hypothetical protein
MNPVMIICFITVFILSSLNHSDTYQRRLDLLELLLDFEDPLERLDPEDVARAGDELLEPELDLVTLGVLLDLLLPEDVERVTDGVLDTEPDPRTLEVLVPDDVFSVLPGVYRVPVLVSLDRRVTDVPFIPDPLVGSVSLELFCGSGVGEGLLITGLL